MDQTNYEEMTVPELKDLAESRGIEIPHDARKAEVVAALEASDFLLSPPAEEKSKSAEGKNVYEYQMSSTETALVSPEDFRVLKLSW